MFLRRSFPYVQRCLQYFLYIQKTFLKHFNLHIDIAHAKVYCAHCKQNLESWLVSLYVWKQILYARITEKKLCRIYFETNFTQKVLKVTKLQRNDKQIF